jgi:hypothetical protein
MVYVTGIMNPKGEPNSVPTFALTEREVDVLSGSVGSTTPLMLEHAYDASTSAVGMQRVGIVVAFWKATDGKLWGVVHVDEQLPMGPRAIRGLIMNRFRGFSLGVSYDGRRFIERNEVLKLGLMEVSLVEAPDHADTLVVAMEGMAPYAGWFEIETTLTAMYAHMCQPLDEAMLDFFVVRRDLWSCVLSLGRHQTAARAHAP